MTVSKAPCGLIFWGLRHQANAISPRFGGFESDNSQPRPRTKTELEQALRCISYLSPTLPDLLVLTISDGQ
jgi:hypothetical protein